MKFIKNLAEEVSVTNYLNSKSKFKSAAATLTSAMLCMSIALCVISAVPENRSGAPKLTIAEDTVTERVIKKLEIPQIKLIAQPLVTEEKAITFSSKSPVFAAPLIEDSDETVESEATEPETVETAASETTVAETTVAETTVAETTTAETESPVFAPGPITSLPSDGNSGSLADKLMVAHTIVPQKTEISEEEVYITAIIVQLEVMGNGSSLYKFEDVQEKYWEMLSVAQCIRNRAKSRYFPSSPKDVIFQNHTTPSGRVIYQFSPAKNLSGYTPTAEAITAAREVLVDGVTVLPENYYYFCASRIEESFERGNSYGFVRKDDGTFEKVQGHLTTFYAGRP